jgi:hypothetical protein
MGDLDPRPLASVENGTPPPASNRDASRLEASAVCLDCARRNLERLDVELHWELPLLDLLDAVADYLRSEATARRTAPGPTEPGTGP